MIYCNEDYKKIKRFPKIDSSADQRPGQTSVNNALSYIDKTESKGDIAILRCWAELADPLYDAHELSQIIAEMEKSNEIFGIKHNQYSLNLAAFSQFKKFQRLLPRVQELNTINSSGGAITAGGAGGYGNSNPKIAIIIYVKREVQNSLKEFLNPEFVSPPLP